MRKQYVCACRERRASDSGATHSMCGCKAENKGFMARTVALSLEDVKLTYGGKPLFDGITIHINEGDKICLIGKNGAGKTTLMKMIMGELELDGGSRYLLPGTTIGYLAQTINFTPEQTVLSYVCLLYTSDAADE